MGEEGGVTLHVHTPAWNSEDIEGLVHVEIAPRNLQDISGSNTISLRRQGTARPLFPLSD